MTVSHGHRQYSGRLRSVTPIPAFRVAAGLSLDRTRVIPLTRHSGALGRTQIVTEAISGASSDAPPRSSEGRAASSRGARICGGARLRA